MFDKYLGVGSFCTSKKVILISVLKNTEEYAELKKEPGKWCDVGGHSAQWLSCHLEYLHLMLEWLVVVPATLFPIELPANMYFVRQLRMAQVLESLLPILKAD